MSERELTVNPGEARKYEYRSISTDAIMEALWEALDTLENQGIDIGSKASGILKQRENIKNNIPK